MINTKPNRPFFLYFFLWVAVAFQACTTNDTFTFEKQKIATETLLDCKKKECASIKINLVQVLDNTPACKTINSEIEKAASSVLTIEEDQSYSNIDQAVKGFNRSYEDASNEFPEEIPPYEATVDCELSFQGKTMISVIMDSYIFTGGAHGYGAVSFINLDTKTGKPIKNKDLFKDYSAFMEYAERVFRSKYEILQNESINSTGFFFDNDTFALPENIGITNTEVILYYNAYEISSYAEGPIEIKINKQDAASYFAFDIL